MRTLTALFLLLGLTIPCYSQVNCIMFNYDQFGNREFRGQDAGCDEVPPARKPNSTGDEIPELITQESKKSTGNVKEETKELIAKESVKRQKTHYFFDVRLYPNPAKDFLTVSGLDNESIKIVRILSPQRQLVKEWETRELKPIAIHFLSKGMYILEIETAGRRETFGFIKN